MKEVLGVDIGMVLMGARNMGIGKDDPGFADAYLGREEVPGAIDAVARLSRERFDGRVYVVSKRGRTTRALAIEWLRRRDFWRKVGIGLPEVRFCRTREAKGPICAELGVTHFVDNRLEVLSHLATVPYRFLINAEEEEVALFAEHLPRVTRVGSWEEILRLLL